MSSPSYITTISLDIILRNLYRFGGPLLIIIGTISSVMNIIMYSQRNFRQKPTSIYIIARNISNLFFIYLSILYETLLVGYSITFGSSNLDYCRFSNYMTLVFDILSPFYLFLTVIDRFFATSLNLNIRKFSTHRLAYMLSTSGLLFWMLFHIHTFFFVEIVHMRPNYFYCYFQLGSYSTFITYYSLFAKGVLFPLLLIIFGWWTIKMFRKNTCRIMNISTLRSVLVIQSFRIQLHDRDIILMLMKDVIIYLMFTSIMSIIFLYELITQHHIKNMQQEEIEYFIRYCGIFFVSIPFCISLYTNLFVSKTFRQQIANICCFRHV